MAKYIDAELLRKEIERHIKEVKEAENRFHPNLGFFDAKLSGIYDILSIIESLESEKPVPADLEEAAWEYASKECEKAAFITGANWQKERDEDMLTVEYLKGAEWGKQDLKEQMMKEAIGCNAYPNDKEIWVDLARYGYKFKEGEPCRIIIVKED